MYSDIGVSLGLGTRSILLGLQATERLIGQTQQRLATGKRVNTALDNPSSFFTASAMTSRAADINRLMDSIVAAKQAMQAASDAAVALRSLSATARSVALQARQTSATISTTVAASVSGTGTLSPDAVATATGSLNVSGQTNFVNNTAINDGHKLKLKVDGVTHDITFDASDPSKVQDGADLLTAINAISGVSASFNGSGQLVIVRDDSVNSFEIEGGTDNSVRDALGVTETTYNATNLLSQGISAGQTLTITVGSGSTQTITFGTNSGAGQVASLSELNTKIAALTGLSTKTLNVSNGGISLTASSVSDAITIGGTATLSKFGLTAGTINPATGQTIANPIRDSLRLQFNSLLTQIDQAVTDASYDGVNLLAGQTLSVLFNETGTSSLSVTGSDLSSSALGFSQLVSGDFDTDSDIDDVLAQLDAADRALTIQSSAFETDLAIIESREAFSDAMIASLQSAADALTLADMEEENALLLALEVRRGIAQQALSIVASQEDQIRTLFGLD